MLRGLYTISDHHLEALASALEVRPIQLLPEGLSQAELDLIDAARSGDATRALHSLAVVLDTTVASLVRDRAAGPRGGLDSMQLASVGQATAALVAQIAHVIAESPQEAAGLAQKWLSTHHVGGEPQPVDD